MNILNWFRGQSSLTNQDRQTIWRTFGNLAANQFGTKGLSLLQNSYESNVDVFAIIKKIIDTSKSIPWIVEQRQANGNFKELKDTTLHELMNTPNISKGYTWNDIEEMILLYLLCNGNTYLFGESQFNSSLIEEIDILPPDFVTIESNEDFFLPQLKYKFQLGKSKRIFEKEAVSHIKFFNPSYSTINESFYGLSIIKVAARVVQTGNDVWDAKIATYQNRGAGGMLTDKSQRPMTPEQASKAQEALDERIAGVNKSGKTIVTNKDLSYIQLAMSPQDLQLLESGVINLRSICNVFGLDSSLFNDPENKTYSNRTEAEKALFTNAIMPLSDKIAEHLTRYLCKNHFPDKNVRLRQDFSKIEVLQENFKDKATILISLKNSGIITANEAREDIDMDAVTDDENADKLIISTTLLSNIGNNGNTQAQTNAGTNQGSSGN